MPTAAALESGPYHAVQFYEGDDFLAEVTAKYVGDGLAAGEAVIVIATEAHRESLLSQLAARSEPVDLGQLTLLDARKTLSLFMVDGMPDWDRFRAEVGTLVAECSADRPLRAYGEMVDLLWQDGNHKAALRLEEQWNDLGRLQSFALLCAYDMSKFHRDAHGTALLELCHSHSHVAPTERFMRLDGADQRLREVTQLQQRARALEAEVEERKKSELALKEALRLRDDFLSIAGHELRSPLTSVQLLMDSLVHTTRDAADGPVHKRLQRTARSLERLSRLVEELLDVSRISAGRLQLNRESLELGELVREVIDSQRDLDAAGSELQLEADVEVVGKWDRLRIEQVVANLFSNARKYGDGKPVEVRLERRPEGARISVRDHGIGISAEDQQRIFDRFERAASNQNGFGLGLWIVKQVVDAHGGTIQLTSEEGKGSTFVVELPYLPA